MCSGTTSSPSPSAHISATSGEGSGSSCNKISSFETTDIASVSLGTSVIQYKRWRLYTDRSLPRQPRNELDSLQKLRRNGENGPVQFPRAVRTFSPIMPAPSRQPCVWVSHLCPSSRKVLFDMMCGVMLATRDVPDFLCQLLSCGYVRPLRNVAKVVCATWPTALSLSDGFP